MRSQAAILLLIGILALGAFFRFYLITEIPPGLYPDEAMNGNNALEALAAGNFKVFYPENNGREGLYINLQAIALWVFGKEAWVLRVVSALFGTLTILGVYLLSRELFATSKNLEFRIKNLEVNKLNSKFQILNSELVALLSSLFLATSYWHINFSRIGFRAILVPFLATFGLYFLLKGLRRGKILDLVLAGVFIGLGFHTYIAWRFMPFVIAIPIIWYLWLWWESRKNNLEFRIKNLEVNKLNSKFQILNSTCSPCAVLLFLFITFITALPIGWYFLENPQDFFGRATDVSIFSAESPLAEFIKSNIATAGMFFFRGDCNWRHNLACQPELNPIMAAFLLIGIIAAGRGLLNLKHEARNSKQIQNSNAPNSKPFGIFNFEDLNLFRISDFGFRISLLLVWLFFMSFPATLTKEGLPHALRSIGMIPPIIILAGFGAWRTITKIVEWIESQKEKWPQYRRQLLRIHYEVLILFILLLLWMPFATYRQYFVRWANNPNTRDAFSASQWELGKYLNEIPNDVQKIVVVNLSGVDVRGIPMPAQTVMFATDTFREKERREKNIVYLNPLSFDFSTLTAEKKRGETNNKILIAPLNADDRELIAVIKKTYPEFQAAVPGNFIIFKNY